MQKENFKQWLAQSAGFADNAINSRMSECSRIEQGFGDLDSHFERDQLSSVLQMLRYSKDDKSNNRPQPKELDIEGDVYNVLASLRQAVRRYIDFKEELELTPIPIQETEIENIDNFNHNSISEPEVWSQINEEVIERKENTILLLAIKDLQQLSFTIGRYQRGYKWGKKEILELLNDIRGYDKSKGIYCLQPIILKPLEPLQKKKILAGDREYDIYKFSEIIDGQQRCTTLFFLFSYLKHSGRLDNFKGYSIDFQTRKNSGLFLSQKLKYLLDFDVSTILDSELLKRDYRKLDVVNSLWANFITEHKEFNNVDVYHFFIVMAYIKKWVDYYLVDKADISVFCEKLLENVKVIWCSLDRAISSNKVIDVFLNNNKGKIDLTSSELIKALYILHIGNTNAKELAAFHINRFALEWDAIEKKLQDDKFWYFVQPKENLYKKGTRIDYLFDLRLGRLDDDDDLFAYRKYEARYNDQELNFIEEWNEITRLCHKLVDWYDDPEFYHYVGYLINTRILTLRGILNISKGKPKLKLKEILKDKIRDHFAADKHVVDEKELLVYAVENLHYKNFPKQTKKVLLLHNLLYYIENMAGHKFPFSLYVKNNWSIEHIVPQTPKQFDDFEMYKNWFTEQVEYQGNVADSEIVILALRAKGALDDLKSDLPLQNRVNELIRDFEDTTHQLQNLLLLDSNTNSALQNGFFPQKREKILELDRNGSYEGKPVFIPIETLNAFNKTFSMQMEYKHWTKSDGDSYRDAIAKRLAYFLPITL